MKRISRGTPYILTEADLDNLLKSLTPRMEANICALLEMTVEDWRKLGKRVQARHLVDFQNRGVGAASLAAAAKAQTDLEEAAQAVTLASQAQSIVDDVAALKEMVHDLAAGRKAVK